MTSDVLFFLTVKDTSGKSRRAHLADRLSLLEDDPWDAVFPPSSLLTCRREMKLWCLPLAAMESSEQARLPCAFSDWEESPVAWRAEQQHKRYTPHSRKRLHPVSWVCKKTGGRKLYAHRFRCRKLRPQARFTPCSQGTTELQQRSTRRDVSASWKLTSSAGLYQLFGKAPRVFLFIKQRILLALNFTIVSVLFLTSARVSCQGDVTARHGQRGTPPVT